MILIQLQGGLGNQMFQYATAKALSLTTKSDLYLDLSFLDQNQKAAPGFTLRKYELNIFRNIEESLAEEKVRRQFYKNKKKGIWRSWFKRSLEYTYQEKSLFYYPHVLSLKPPVLLKGYFQSEKYFKEYRLDILTCFEFPKLKGDDENTEVLKKITSSNSVSIHIRRGDFLNPVTNEVHGLCGVDYYKKAISWMRERFRSCVFILFSDDPDWVMKELFPLTNGILVNSNLEKNSWKDMYLMSQCKHHIVANSSFSWWGAWLNESPDKVVIAPKKWIKNDLENQFSDSIAPEEWLRM